jgi:transcriptional regulator with XRE-family HTH domain
MSHGDARTSEPLSLGRWFYLLRKRQGLSQEEVANAAGLSVATYGRIERSLGAEASMNPRLDTIRRLFEAVHAEPADLRVLFCGESSAELEMASENAEDQCSD